MLNLPLDNKFMPEDQPQAEPVQVDVHQQYIVNVFRHDHNKSFPFIHIPNEIPVPATQPLVTVTIVYPPL